MSGPERIGERVAGLVRKVAGEALQRVELTGKRRMRSLKRLLKIAVLMWLATIAIVVTMIASGHLLGPTGAEGWLATPIALIAAWAVILYWFRAPRTTARTLQSRDLSQLAADTGEWLYRQRGELPAGARPKLDSIMLQLEALSPQLRVLDPNKPAAAEVRRLIAEELPELVDGYQKVPVALKRQSLHGGPSPDRQLAEGLATVDEELARMHSRLAVDDLHALATQQRYLEAKYKGDGKIK
jgi:hypothetical protein